jgi:hypothetical protein
MEVPAGFRLRQRQNEYELIGMETADSGKFLLIWRSNCFECGEQFEFKSPVVVEHLNKRCALHAAPGRCAGKRKYSA